MYTTYHIFTVLPIKQLVNQDGEATTPQKLVTGTKPSVSNIRVLFCPFVVRKQTENIGRKALTICHQPQKGFRIIFVGITQHQKGYLIYIPSTQEIVSSHGVVFENRFPKELAYTSLTYSRSLATQPEVLYVLYAKTFHEQTRTFLTLINLEE